MFDLEKKSLVASIRCLRCATCIFKFNSLHTVARARLRCASRTNWADPVGQDSAINYLNNLSFSLLSLTNICWYEINKSTAVKLVNGQQTDALISKGPEE